MPTGPAKSRSIPPITTRPCQEKDMGMALDDGGHGSLGSWLKGEVCFLTEEIQGSTRAPRPFQPPLA